MSRKTTSHLSLVSVVGEFLCQGAKQFAVWFRVVLEPHNITLQRVYPSSATPSKSLRITHKMGCYTESCLAMTLPCISTFEMRPWRSEPPAAPDLGMRQRKRLGPVEIDAGARYRHQP